MRRISPHARELRREMTNAERAIWSALRDRQLDGFKFRRQVTVGPFIVDFLCAEVGLIVEIDCGQHSEEVDAGRTAKLIAAGYRVVRYWNNDVLSNLAGVLQDLHTHLASPSPAGGRGSG